MESVATVTAHPAIIAAGPSDLRRLCCGTDGVADHEAAEMSRVALEAMDDHVALVNGRPIDVASLWRTALGSVTCAHSDGIVVVHPSWWSRSRVDVVTAAARTLTGDPNSVVVQPRSWLLTRSSAELVVVEISERLVVVCSGAPDGEVGAVARRTDPLPVVDEVAGVISGMTGDVLIDGPDAVPGAPALAALIAAAVRRSGSREVREIDDAGLAQLAQLAKAAASVEAEPRPVASGRVPRSRARTVAQFAAAGVVLAAVPAVLPVVGAPDRHGGAALQKAPDNAPATYLVEGRVALTVPADWSTQRVILGPGSARIQVTSPSDPEVALHVTQSPVPGETLTGTADRLRRAIDAEPAGVFVEFDPAGSTAGRPAVTYREVRAAHQVRWTVLLDGSVRISVGCQSRPGGEAAVRDACELAVRSARAVG